METKIEILAGVARAATLATLNIHTYTGRKLDRATQAEVTTAKASNSKRAASVHKNLFAECKELEDITKFCARVRNEHYRLTLPWSDSGARLLPALHIFEYQGAMTRFEAEFERLTGAFLDKYDTLVAAAAFQLGALFDRTEYPLRSQMLSRFSFSVAYDPVPMAGDFRLDVEATVQRQLAEAFEARAAQALQAANRDAWERLHTVLTRMSDRLVVEDDGTKRRFHDTLVANAEELCDLLGPLNVTNDPDLTRAQELLKLALQGVTVDALRKEESTRIETKRKIDEMLSGFDWFTRNGGGQ